MVYILNQYPRLTHARACKLMACSRKQKYYQKRMPFKDGEVKDAIAATIGTSRKGRVKVITLVQKTHPELSAYRIRRVYEQEGYTLHRRLKRRLKGCIANPVQIPLAANQEWAIDFMSDALIDGRRIRTLNIVDHFDRSCKGIEINTSLPARRVVEYLDRVIDCHGQPKTIRTDNGPEFRSKHFQSWLHKRKIKWSPIQPGKPQQNAIVERFNRTFREDILDANLFKSIAQAQGIAQAWVHEYNHIRPHQSLKQLTPYEYARKVF